MLNISSYTIYHKLYKTIGANLEMRTFIKILALLVIVLSTITTVAFASTDYTEYIHDNIIANSAGVSFTQLWMRNYLTTDPENAAEGSEAYTTIIDGSGDLKSIYIVKGKTAAQFEAQVDKALVNNDGISNITDGLVIGEDPSSDVLNNTNGTKENVIENNSDSIDDALDKVITSGITLGMMIIVLELVIMIGVLVLVILGIIYLIKKIKNC